MKMCISTLGRTTAGICRCILNLGNLYNIDNISLIDKKCHTGAHHRGYVQVDINYTILLILHVSIWAEAYQHWYVRLDINFW